MPKLANWLTISSRGNRSIPAGTGVWVVKTVPARLRSSAVSKSSPAVQVLPDPLQAEEARVPSLVWNTWGAGRAGDRAVRADGPYAADAEQHLLGQPVVAAAAVQPVGDLPLVAGVLLHIGVEQQQRNPADLGQPDLGVQRPAGQRHLDPDRAVLPCSKVTGSAFGSSSG